MSEPEQSDDEYPLAPPDETLAEHGPPAWIETEPPEDVEPERFQFSVAELLGLVTAVAVLLSVSRIFPGSNHAAAFAGITGLAVLATLVVMDLVGVKRPIVRTGWWVLLGLYLLICVMAVIGL
jgi:hypothetical protein